MTQVTVEQAGLRLANLLDAAMNGEEVVVVDRNDRAVRLVPVAHSTAVASSRPAEWLKGQWALPDSFFDPLPDEVLDLFEGTGRP